MDDMENGADKKWRDALEKMQYELSEVTNESVDNNKTVELDQTKVGRLSRIDALQSQAMHNAVAARRRDALRRIEAAFVRLDEGEFGFCAKCGDEISVERLAIDPTTAMCTECLGDT